MRIYIMIFAVIILIGCVQQQEPVQQIEEKEEPIIDEEASEAQDNQETIEVKGEEPEAQEELTQKEEDDLFKDDLNNSLEDLEMVEEVEGLIQ